MAFQKSDKSGAARPRRAGGFRSRKKVCAFCGEKSKPREVRFFPEESQVPVHLIREQLQQRLSVQDILHCCRTR